MIVLLLSLPRGFVLFGCLLVCLALVGHFLAAGDFASAAKVVLPAVGLSLLFWLRVRPRAG